MIYVNDSNSGYFKALVRKIKHTLSIKGGSAVCMSNMNTRT